MLPARDGGPLAGIPERLRIDHGLEFCAHAVRDACLALDVELSLATEYGVRLRNRMFMAPDLCELVGEEVAIAFAPHDYRSVEVFWRGQRVWTALAQETLMAGEQQQIINARVARVARARELRKRQRAAARLTRTRLAPLTDGARAQVELPEAHSRPWEQAVAGERDLRAGARVDLLVDGGSPRARRR